ncbi:DUF4129 domain-containing protein [Actinophytocola sp.]|uniref:DUF4129 domain-containing protein n=1 Tax=Actinophytocola sp. TaxID=1872138 RepID=UPI002D809F75|nr:DUF4129 domain-containing protein [Actinophytocola sp.]HET9138406.1 DUF4129 domain-containing protein [Actinophytocola sp.]
MIPVEVAPDEARDAAIRELSDPIYSAADPTLFEKIGDWLVDLLDGIGSVGPGGLVGLVVLALAVALTVVIVRLRTGRIARAGRRPGALFDGPGRTAEDHRRAAAAAAGRGDLAEAILERFRAIVRELEQRGVVDELSGRTVDEIAAMAGAALPAHAPALSGAARVFDDVIYGGRPATVDGYQALTRVDDQLRQARPRLVRT